MKALILSIALTLPAFANRLPESHYRDLIAEKMGGETEVRVENGRVDIVAGDYAIEVERAASWKQSIGQCLWYSLQTGKKAGIIVIIEDDKRDRPHVIRLGSVIQEHQLPIKVWLWPDDFR